MSGSTSVHTVDSFFLDFDSGESFNYQDLDNNIVISFTIASGNLNGTATLTADASGGTLLVTPDSSGTILVSSNNPSLVYILINGALVSSYYFSDGTQFEVLWTFTYPYIPPVIIVGTNGTLYFRSDTFHTNNVTGYGLHTENTATYTTISDVGAGDVDVSFGFRVWHVSTRGVQTELTDGVPIAVVTRSADGIGYQYGYWNCTEKTLTTGMDALKVIVYTRFDSGDWAALAVYITNLLMEKAIRASIWTFTVYTSRVYNTSNTQAEFFFGSADYSSAISGIDFWHPTPQEIALALGLGGDWISMFLYPFMYLIGNIFYGAGLLFLAVLYYLRFKRWEPVLIVILLFGGGGIFGYLIPNVAYRLLYVVVLFVIATQIYRVFN
jgi:hypothetical protein